MTAPGSPTTPAPDFVREAAERIDAVAVEQIATLVAVSSPSGDVPGAERTIELLVGMLPEGVEVERPSCSTPQYAPDLIARLRGTGSGRIVLLGHVDTVIAHESHRPLAIEASKLVGSGSIDMKAGDVLAAGVMRELATRPELYAEIALLAVTDEEWRRRPFAHGPAFAGWDACLCFEGGERDPDGVGDGVVVKRKAAGTLRIEARGVASHSGSAPDAGRNALLGLAAVAQLVTAQQDPAGAERLSAVPTILRSGDAFNVVPDGGELFCDLRADSQASFDRVLGEIPRDVDGVEIDPALIRVWPGMDTREVAAPVVEAASRLTGRPLLARARGGASDASHMAQTIDLVIDGLGPLGGRAHAPEEYVEADSIRPRAEVALAVALAALGAT
ncbi:M20/M25/M40 family metallo-hydrolase [Thermoleophilia bacterium SCSIO 60948]|nr:M20/M25/M40 family metallo-hydrolase [Thermoleophilia bacterium SCSIO 60948]